MKRHPREYEGDNVIFNPSVEMTPDEFRQAGLLWLVNTSVFHPRGLALSVADNGNFVLFYNEDPDEVAGYGPTPDGSTKWIDEIYARFRKFEAWLRSGDPVSEDSK